MKPHSSPLCLQQGFLFPALISAVSAASKEARLGGMFTLGDSAIASVEGEIHFNKMY